MMVAGSDVKLVVASSHSFLALGLDKMHILSTKSGTARRGVTAVPPRRRLRRCVR